MKKFLSVILAIAIVAALLAGCGGTQSTQTSSSSAVSSAAAASSQATTQTEPAKAAEIKSFGHMTDPIKLQGYNDIISAFKKTTPGINITHEDMDFNNFNTTLKTRMAAGDAPDLIFGRPAERMDLIEAGQIEDITNKVDFSNISDGDKAAVSKDGKIYGAPMDIASRVVFYNKDLFQKAGVDIPKTQSDFIKVCEALKAKGILPILLGFKDVGFFSTVAWQADFFGGPLMKTPSFFVDVSSRAKKFADFPEFKTSLERWDNYMKNYANKDAFSIDYATCLSKFAAGAAAMVFQGPWAPGTIVKNNPQGNFGSFPLPTYDDSSQNAINTQVDDCFMLSSQSKVKDQVEKFMSFLLTKDAADIWVKETGNISIVKGAMPCENPMTRDMQSFINKGDEKVFNDHSIINPVGKYADTLWATLEEFAADNNRSAEKTIKKLDDQFDKLAGK